MADEAIKSKRKSVNLTIREDVIAQAKALGLNASQSAEAGLVAAIAQAKAEAWRRDNATRIDAHNARVESEGVLLSPRWAEA